MNLKRWEVRIDTGGEEVGRGSEVERDESIIPDSHNEDPAGAFPYAANATTLISTLLYDE